MTIGFIMAAGEQCRFWDKTPKALACIDGRRILDINLELMRKYCDECFVVCSNNNKNWFIEYNRIVIDSGLGCGDAVARALDKYIYRYKPDKDTQCFIQWGDSIQTEDVYNSIDFSYTYDSIQIPYYEEKNPYVHLIMCNNRICKILFKKYGEIDNIENGCHDCSLFYGNIYYIYNECIKFMNSCFKSCRESEDLNYYANFNPKHGLEFNFLDIFNDVKTTGIGRLVNKNIPKAFNTVEELIMLGGYTEN